MPGVVVVGEALVDEITTPSGTASRPGGSCLNVAVGLARLGTPVTFVTSFGDDEPGQLLSQHLDGIDVVRDVAPTSRALAHVDDMGVARYDFRFQWQLEDLPIDVPADGHLHLGSLGAVCPPGAARVLELARRHAGTLSYDVNWREGPTPADARERVTRLMSLATVVKLSEEDLDALDPRCSGEALARRLLDEGVEVVVVTRGGDGAEAWTSSASWRVPALEGGSLVDTVGAGDAFMAGFLHAWLEDRDVGRALEVATWTARLTCERLGADPPSAVELRRAMAATAS